MIKQQFWLQHQPTSIVFEQSTHYNSMHFWCTGSN